MNYKVGQVLYVILRKEASVYPMQVVKEIHEKTLEGEVVTYMVRVGANASKVVAITDIDGELFDSAEKAKVTLIQRVSSSISQRVDNAVSKAKEWYPTGFEAPSDDPLTLLKKSTLAAGEQPQPRQKKVAAPKAETAQLAAELQAEADEAEGAVIELPDGTKAKVKSVKLPTTLQS